MKTRVNLYTEVFKPKKEKLTLVHFLVFAVVLFIILGALVHQVSNKVESLKQQQTSLEFELEQMNTEVEILLSAVEQHVQNPQLVQYVNKLRSEVGYSEHILEELSKLAIVQSSGFSIFMSDLAHLRDEDIQLNDFTISDEKITLTGIARNHKSIPRWITQFEKGVSLKGREFDRLSIGRDDNDVITFILTNQLKLGKGL